MTWGRIERYMVRTGKTWAQVGADIKCSTAMLSMVKTGKRNLSKKALFRLEEAERVAGLSPPTPVVEASTARETSPDYGAKSGPVKKVNTSEIRRRILSIERELRELRILIGE